MMYYSPELNRPFKSKKEFADYVGLSESYVQRTVKAGLSVCDGKYTLVKKKHVYNPEYIDSEHVNSERTLNEFGYLPYEVPRHSSLLIYVVCPVCKTEYSRKKQKYRLGAPCHRCVFSSCRYIPPKKPIVSAPVFKRQSVFDHPYIHTIRTGLRRIIVAKKWKSRGTIRHLDYTAEDLRLHIDKELKNGCCICNSPINGEFHIAHIIPQSWATNLEEALWLNSFTNLSVAHPKCNAIISATPVFNRFVC